jgi:hypothetical protein
MAVKVGGKVRLTKRRTGIPKGNAYVVLAIHGNKAVLQAGAMGGYDKTFQLRDLS